MASAPLPTATLGDTGVEVSRVGLGTAPLGGLFEPVSDADAAATLRAAWDGGIRFFDTAPWYGFGRAEVRVGDALRGRTGLTLSTKVGRVLVPSEDPPGARHGWPDPLPLAPVHDYGRDGVLRSFEDSLDRLGLERVDVLFVHDIGRATHGADHGRHFEDAMGGGLGALQELKAAGRIGALGIGVNETAVLMEAMQHAHWDVFLVAGRYTLLEQPGLDDVLPACEAAGTSVIIGGAFNSGLLAGGGTWNYAPAPPEMLARRDRLREVCAAHGVALEAAALQFPQAHPAVASVLMGCRHAGEVVSNLRHVVMEIPDALWGDLRSEGLVRRDAPLPS